MQDRLPVPLYDKHPIEARVRDACGIIISVPVYTFSTEARQYREADTLEKELTRRGWLRRTRIGNTTLLLAELPRIVECVELMASEGRLLYSASSPVGHGKGH
jgi:hypothetical protein